MLIRTILCFFILCSAACAQPQPGPGPVPGMPISGGTFTGKVTTAPSSASTAMFNLNCATAPASPISGDMWCVQTGGGVGLYVKIGSTTYGPINVAGGSITSVSVASANGFSGTSSGGSTPALSLSITVAGLLKGSGGSVVAATSGTDYLSPTGNGSGLTGITYTQVAGLGTFATQAAPTGTVQCLHANSVGVVTGTGADCGSGSGLTIGAPVSGSTANDLLYVDGGNHLANQSLANLMLSPPAIGGTTPAPGAFTTLGATGQLTTNVTGSTQCLHANSAGVVMGTGTDCGSGGGGGGGIVITCNGTDVGAAINSALAANTLVILTGGTCKYNTSGHVVGPIVLPAWACLVGGGADVTILENDSATANGINFSPGNLQGGCIQNMTVQAGPAKTFVINVSSGVGIYLNQAEYNFTVFNVIVRNYATGISCNNSYQVNLSTFTIQNYTTGLYLNGGACGFIINGQASNTTSSSPNTGTGVLVNGDLGSVVNTVAVFGNNVGWSIGGGSINFVMTQAIAVGEVGVGGSNGFNIGGVYNVSCTGCWSGSNQGYGVAIGVGGTTVGFNWSGGQVYGNGLAGVNVGSASGRIAVNGALISGNGNVTSGTGAAGVVVASSGGTSLVGNTILNTNTSQQNYGVVLSGTPIFVQITGNNLINNTIAGYTGTPGTAGLITSNMCASGAC